VGVATCHAAKVAVSIGNGVCRANVKARTTANPVNASKPTTLPTVLNSFFLVIVSPPTQNGASKLHLLAAQRRDFGACPPMKEYDLISEMRQFSVY
jgi:hypothetical protein